MKIVCCNVLFLIVGILSFGQEVPKSMRIDPTIKITKVLQTGNISLEIGNPSKEPLDLWEDSNSWGAARWRVLRIRRGQVEVFFQNPYRIFTVNVTTTIEIAPGAHVETTLDVNGGSLLFVQRARAGWQGGSVRR